MKKFFTTQDVIDMASKLYDEENWPRDLIYGFLATLRDNNKWDVPIGVVDSVFDLVVG